MSALLRLATITVMGLLVITSATVIAQEKKQHIKLTPLSVARQPIGTPSEDSIKHQKEVTQLIKQINPQNMLADLTVLVQYPDRHANSTYTVNNLIVEDFIKNQMETIAQNSGRK